MENNSDSDAKLIPFLRNLADSIENKKLVPKQLESIGEFFMAYQFQEQAIRDNDNSETVDRRYSSDELVKFIILGWYIYCCILTKDVKGPMQLFMSSEDDEDDTHIVTEQSSVQVCEQSSEQPSEQVSEQVKL
jgi:hypothetical protein